MTRISTPFDATSTVAEVLSGVDLTGRRALVTGGGSGGGLAVARALAGAGAEVTVAVPDRQAGRRAAADGGAAVRVRRLDLLDRDSIAAFVAAWDGPLDILVNHDGIAPPPVRRLTDDGVEVQFALGHLAHLALTLGLFQALEAAAQASGEARVVAVSSAGHLRSPVVLDDLGFDRRAYDPGLAQAQAKTAVVLFAVAASRHWATDGITVNAVNGDGPAGPATTVLAAASPLLKGVGGRYLEDVGEAIAAGPAGRSGVAAHAVDPEAASCLWDTSLAMLAPWATAARMVPA